MKASILATGLYFGEGPRWRDGRLLVVSMERRQLLRVDADGGKVHADLSRVAAYHANDMVVDGQGRAYVGDFGFALAGALKEHGVEGVLAQHPTATLARVDPDGTVFKNIRIIEDDEEAIEAGQGRNTVVPQQPALPATPTVRRGCRP